ncbi:MAG: transposase [Pseudomonadota bacterium]|nr:transposase [Pseudomonadota bacterium]
MGWSARLAANLVKVGRTGVAATGKVIWAETFSPAFPCGLTQSWLWGVKPVISDAHDGLNAAVARVLEASRQHGHGHSRTNATIVFPHKNPRQVLFVPINSVFVQRTAEAARAERRMLTDPSRPKSPKPMTRADRAAHSALTIMDFPEVRAVKVRSTNVLDRLNGDIRRSAHVPANFPDEDATPRLARQPCSSGRMNTEPRSAA